MTVLRITANNYFKVHIYVIFTKVIKSLTWFLSLEFVNTVTISTNCCIFQMCRFRNRCPKTTLTEGVLLRNDAAQNGTLALLHLEEYQIQPLLFLNSLYGFVFLWWMGQQKEHRVTLNFTFFILTTSWGLYIQSPHSLEPQAGYSQEPLTQWHPHSHKSLHRPAFLYNMAYWSEIEQLISCLILLKYTIWKNENFLVTGPLWTFGILKILLPTFVSLT